MQNLKMIRNIVLRKNFRIKFDLNIELFICIKLLKWPFLKKFSYF